jgi:2-haloacid dehalogenase
MDFHRKILIAQHCTESAAVRSFASSFFPRPLRCAFAFALALALAVAVDFVLAFSIRHFRSSFASFFSPRPLRCAFALAFAVAVAFVVAFSLISAVPSRPLFLRVLCVTAFALAFAVAVAFVVAFQFGTSFASSFSPRPLRFAFAFALAFSIPRFRNYNAAMPLQALLFDVFGTVVDWRTGIARAGEEFGHANRISDVDWLAFADQWRALYQPTLERVRSGEMPFRPLDDLHRMELDKLLADHRITGTPEESVDRLNRGWHRLPPWPDAVPALRRMKKKYILGTLSNGNVAQMVALARYADLPWDAVLGAELAEQYKPRPEVYKGSIALLRLRPEDCCMVAAHNYDLEAARRCGMKCAFVTRPDEYGPAGKPDLLPSQPWEFVARDFADLASQLGC